MGLVEIDKKEYMALFGRFVRRLDDLHYEIVGLEVEIRILEQNSTEGVVRWRPGYKERSNMYLYHTVDTERVQNGGSSWEYIGADPERQAEATKRVENYKRLLAARSEIRDKREAIAEAKYYLTRLESALFGTIQQTMDLFSQNGSGNG